MGASSASEATVPCAPGEPDGQANEIDCSPLPVSLLVSGAHAGFVATLASPIACGAPFALYVRTISSASFAPAGEIAYSGDCTARALEPPVLHGTPAVGRLLRATPPRWSEPPSRVAYAWQRCTTRACEPIPGAAGLTLRLTRSDAGRAVRFVATALLGGTRVESASKPLAVR